MVRHENCQSEIKLHHLCIKKRGAFLRELLFRQIRESPFIYKRRFSVVYYCRTEPPCGSNWLITDARFAPIDTRLVTLHSREASYAGAGVVFAPSDSGVEFLAPLNLSGQEAGCLGRPVVPPVRQTGKQKTGQRKRPHCPIF